MPKQRERRRVKSPHPGVVLRREKIRDGERWRARWRDPDSGRACFITLDGKELQLTTREGRYRWAVDKSKALAERRAEIAARGRVVQSLSVADAFKSYIKGKKAECRPLTVDGYEQRLAVFMNWLKNCGVQETGALTVFHLAEFRTHVLAMKKRQPAKGKKRGRHRMSAKPLGARRRNDLLSAAGTLLAEWRRLGLLKNIDSDSIRDALRPVKRERPLPEFLRPDAVRQLLGAAVRHDAEMFRLTREEHDGAREPGTTPRYPSAAPFLLTALLTGARRAEVEGLRWDEVRLGENAILLGAERVKTREGRRVDLEVSPSLAELLKRLRIRGGGGGLVFPDWAAGNLAKSTQGRLRRFGAPRGWTYQALRRTCSTVLTNMRAVGAWVSSKRCGHSVVVAEQSYAGLLTVPDDARTLEAALGIEGLAADIVAAAGGTEEAAVKAREA